jgi:hypothetical protein
MRRLLGVLTIVAAAVLLLEVSPGSAAGGGPPASSVPDDTLAIIVNQSNTIDDWSLKISGRCSSRAQPLAERTTHHAGHDGSGAL